MFLTGEAPQFDPLVPRTAEIVVGAVALVLLLVTIVGGGLALRREARAGRPVTSWLLAFCFAGPLAVLAYGATQMNTP